MSSRGKQSDRKGEKAASSGSRRRAVAVTPSTVETAHVPTDSIERLLTEGLKASSDGSLVLDNELRILSLNGAVERILQGAAKDARGLPFFDAFPGWRGSIFEERLTRAASLKSSACFIASFEASLRPEWYEVRLFAADREIEMYFLSLADRVKGRGMTMDALDIITRSLASASRHSVHADSGRVVLLEELGGGNESFPRESAEEPKTNSSGRPVWIHRIRAKAVLRGTPVLVNDPPPASGQRTMENLLCVPLMFERGIRGFLEVANKKGGFSTDDVRNLTPYAERAVLALQPLWARGIEPREDLHKALFDSMQEAVYVHDFHDQIVDANRGAWESLGYTREHLMSLDHCSLFPREMRGDLSTHLKDLRRAGRAVLEAGHLSRDGSVKPVELSSTLVAYRGVPAVLTVARDLGPRFRREAHRIRAAKMEAIGRLCRAVAAELDLHVGAVRGHAERLLADGTATASQTQTLRRIRETTQRAMDLALRLRCLDGDTPLQNVPCALNRFVTGLEKELRRVLGAEVTLAMSLAPDVGTVLADLRGLERVLLELAVNAREAMRGAGRLEIETWRVPGSDQALRVHPLTGGQDHVLLVVRDSGPGMDMPTLQRLFEPCFTTKARGEARGFGLAMVYEIVRRLGGFIEADSSPGNGATFRLFLPALSASGE